MMERDGDDDLAALPQAEDLRQYIVNGTPTNHFLTAVLSNDLIGAIGRSDPVNRAALPDYVAWLKSYAPGLAYGSRERVEAWIAHYGLSGLETD